MKRNMELVRQILTQIEERSRGIGQVAIDIPGYTPQEVYYHIKLLHDAGLVEAWDCSAGSLCWAVKDLTFKGHEFLNPIKNEKVWAGVMQTVKEKAIDLPFAVLTTLATKLAADYLGLSK